MVDDDPATTELMRLVLASAGHEVTVTGSVVEALARARAAPPDLVVSDLSLAGAGPDDDGPALARSIRCDPDLAHLPLLAVTGLSSREALRSARDSGFDEVLLKPFDLRDLLARVGTLSGSGPA